VVGDERLPNRRVRIAFCFPGQGSQEVGMGRAFFETVPESRTVYAEAAEAAGFDVAALCFEGPIDELTRTDLQQPALVATSLACLAAVTAAGLRPDVVIGHSVGEYSALGAAGVLSVRDAVALVAARGRATAAAAAEQPGAMAAIIGLDDRVVEQLCAEVGEVWPANYNCPGQLVVSGRTEAVEAMLAAATERGARRTVVLKVTGAFHSPLVVSAADRLRPAIESVRFHPPQTPYMSTVTASIERGDRLGDLLVAQLSAPVRFTQAVRVLVADGVDTFVEIGPGQVLAGLVKRIDRGVTALSVGDPDGLARLTATMAGATA
jgi:[acyl-carrier-protein] S-malonyltransferase